MDLLTIAVFHANQTGEDVISFCDDRSVPVCGVAYAIFNDDSAAIARAHPFPIPDWVHARAPVPDSSGATGRTVIDMYRMCDMLDPCVFWLMYEQLFALVNEELKPDDRPYMLGFMNILPYAYMVDPPLNVPAWIDNDRTISKAAHPDPDVLFADVTLLVVPEVDFGSGWQTGLWGVYGDAVQARFVKVAETEAWSLWRPKPVAARD